MTVVIGAVDTVFAVVSVLVLCAFILPVVWGRVLRDQNSDEKTALWLAATAVLPGAAFVIEMEVRRLGMAREIEFHRFVTFGPSFLGAGFGLLLIVASFVVAPPLRGNRSMDAIRLLQVATWAVTVFVLLAALVDV
jgi:hypothetical protein